MKIFALIEEIFVVFLFKYLIHLSLHNYNLLEDVIFCDESNNESMTQVAAFMAHRKLCKKITRVKIMITIANKKLIYNLFDFAELQGFKCYGK